MLSHTAVPGKLVVSKRQIQPREQSGDPGVLQDLCDKDRAWPRSCSVPHEAGMHTKVHPSLPLRGGHQLSTIKPKISTRTGGSVLTSR